MTRFGASNYSSYGEPYRFEIRVDSDFMGYMAQAHEISQRISWVNSSYRNSRREAIEEILSKLREITYGNFEYEVMG